MLGKTSGSRRGRYQPCLSRQRVEGARRRRELLGERVSVCIFSLLIASTFVTVTGCKERQLAQRIPLPPAVESTEANPDAVPSAGAVTGEFEPAAFSIEFDADNALVQIALGDAKASLGDLLHQAYEKDPETTRGAVRQWLTDDNVLTPVEMSSLLDDVWGQDEGKASEVLRPWFVARMKLGLADIPALLTKAWTYDPEKTREVLRTWGKDHGFFDSADAQALSEYGFTRRDDAPRFAKAVPDIVDAPPVVGVSPSASPEGDPVPVKVCWASNRWIDAKALRFRRDDARLAARRNGPVSLAARSTSEAAIEVVVDEGIDLPENWVQVLDEDFVALAAAYRKVPVPDRDTDEWKNLLGIGVLPAYLSL
ncbi:MAG TPA: hypothetical protein PLO37_00085 [Candidatus Hydrogenedentes bacterium]|nr:hypothetical protein [Candidatus Hydrogenedentota bacterium]HPG65210.1 hypothetical protein [Candidatus Hydrogenedentota bacterium]